jgi:hypothetical protein
LADFILCITRTRRVRRLEVYAENKDGDEQPHFLIDVSAKDSGQPKFQWAGDVEGLAQDMRTLGQQRRERVLEAIGAAGTTREEIERSTRFSRSCVASHLKSLVEEGLAVKDGSNRDTTYRRPSVPTSKDPRTLRRIPLQIRHLSVREASSDSRTGVSDTGGGRPSAVSPPSEAIAYIGGRSLGRTVSPPPVRVARRG